MATKKLMAQTLRDPIILGEMYRRGFFIWKVSDETNKRYNALVVAFRKAMMVEQGLDDVKKVGTLPNDTKLGEKTQVIFRKIRALYTSVSGQVYSR